MHKPILQSGIEGAEPHLPAGLCGDGKQQVRPLVGDGTKGHRIVRDGRDSHQTVVRERIVPVPHGGRALVADQLDADQKGIRRTGGANLGGFGSVSRTRRHVRRRHGRRGTLSSKGENAANALVATIAATLAAAAPPPTRLVHAAADGDGLLQRSLADTVMVLRHCKPRHCAAAAAAAVVVVVVVVVLKVFLFFYSCIANDCFFNSTQYEY